MPQHETAHLVVMLAAFDVAALDRPLDGEADLRKAFFSGYRKVPAFLNEGLADYGLYYTGFFQQWGPVWIAGDARADDEDASADVDERPD